MSLAWFTRDRLRQSSLAAHRAVSSRFLLQESFFRLGWLLAPFEARQQLTFQCITNSGSAAYSSDQSVHCHSTHLQAPGSFSARCLACKRTRCSATVCPSSSRNSICCALQSFVSRGHLRHLRGARDHSLANQRITGTVHRCAFYWVFGSSIRCGFGGWSEALMTRSL